MTPHVRLVRELLVALHRMPGTDFEPLHQTKSGRDDDGNYIPPGGMCQGASDLIGCVFGHRVDIEVKVGRDKQTPAQLLWQARMRACGGVCEVIRSVAEARALVSKLTAEMETLNPTLVAVVRHNHRGRKDHL